MTFNEPKSEDSQSNPNASESLPPSATQIEVRGIKPTQRARELAKIVEKRRRAIAVLTLAIFAGVGVAGILAIRNYLGLNTSSPKIPTHTESSETALPPGTDASSTEEQRAHVATSSPEAVSTEVDYFKLKNKMEKYNPDKNPASSLGNAYWELHQDAYDGNPYIIAYSDDDKLNASMIEVRDTGILDDPNKDRLMYGIPLPAGFQLPNGEVVPKDAYLYNLTYENGVTQILILNKKNKTFTNMIVKDTKGAKKNLFQLLGKGGEARYYDDNAHFQGEYVAIQSQWKYLFGTATPAPTETDHSQSSPNTSSAINLEDEFYSRLPSARVNNVDFELDTERTLALLAQANRNKQS